MTGTLHDSGGGGELQQIYGKNHKSVKPDYQETIGPNLHLWIPSSANITAEVNLLIFLAVPVPGS